MAGSSLSSSTSSWRRIAWILRLISAPDRAESDSASFELVDDNDMEEVSSLAHEEGAEGEPASRVGTRVSPCPLAICAIGWTKLAMNT